MYQRKEFPVAQNNRSFIKKNTTVGEKNRGLELLWGPPIKRLSVGEGLEKVQGSFRLKNTKKWVLGGTTGQNKPCPGCAENCYRSGSSCPLSIERPVWHNWVTFDCAICHDPGPRRASRSPNLEPRRNGPKNFARMRCFPTGFRGENSTIHHILTIKFTTDICAEPCTKYTNKIKGI